jgi:hypothetical protein
VTYLRFSKYVGDLSQGLVSNLVECVGAVKPKSAQLHRWTNREYVEASTGRDFDLGLFCGVCRWQL